MANNIDNTEVNNVEETEVVETDVLNEEVNVNTTDGTTEKTSDEVSEVVSDVATGDDTTEDETPSNTEIVEEPDIRDLYYEYSDRIEGIDDNRYFKYLFEMVRAGENDFHQTNQVLHKVIDESWLSAIEESLEAINRIINKPRKFIKSVEEIVPVGLAKRITADSVKHLGKNTQFIASDPGEPVQPTKILNVSLEETYDLYENRFIYHLIQRLIRFIDKRTDVIFWATGDEKRNKLVFNSVVDDAYEQIEYKLEMTIKNLTSFAENDADNMEVFARIDRVRRLVMSIKSSSFCQIMNGCATVRSPIQRTNLMIKDPDYRTAYRLWQFLENYDDVGYTIEIREDAMAFDQEYVNQMYTGLINNYTVFKSLIEDDDRVLSDKLRKTLELASAERDMKPKFIKEVREEFVESRDIPDVEIRRVFVEEVTEAQLAAEAKAKEAEEAMIAAQEAQKEAEKLMREAQHDAEEAEDRAQAAQKETEYQIKVAADLREKLDTAENARKAAQQKAEEEIADAREYAQKKIREANDAADMKIEDITNEANARIAKMQEETDEKIAAVKLEMEQTIDKAISEATAESAAIAAAAEARAATIEAEAAERVQIAENTVEERAKQAEAKADERAAKAEADADNRVARAEADAENRAAKAAADAEIRATKAEAAAQKTIDEMKAEAEAMLSKEVSEARARAARAEADAEERAAKAETTAAEATAKAEAEVEKTKAEADALVQQTKDEAIKAIDQIQAEANESVEKYRAEIDAEMERVRAEAAVTVARVKADAEDTVAKTVAQSEEQINKAITEANKLNAASEVKMADAQRLIDRNKAETEARISLIVSESDDKLDAAEEALRAASEKEEYAIRLRNDADLELKDQREEMRAIKEERDQAIRRAERLEKRLEAMEDAKDTDSRQMLQRISSMQDELARTKKALDTEKKLRMEAARAALKSQEDLNMLSDKYERATGDTTYVSTISRPTYVPEEPEEEQVLDTAPAQEPVIESVVGPAPEPAPEPAQEPKEEPVQDQKADTKQEKKPAAKESFISRWLRR